MTIQEVIDLSLCLSYSSRLFPVKHRSKPIFLQYQRMQASKLSIKLKDDSESTSFLTPSSKPRNSKTIFFDQFQSKTFLITSLFFNVILVGITAWVTLSLHRLADSITSPLEMHAFGKVPTRTVVWNHDHEYDKDPHDPEGPWEAIIPVGQGFIRVSDPRNYNLASGVPIDNKTSPTEEGYLVSMYHQLHCIAVLKRTVSVMENPNNTLLYFPTTGQKIFGGMDLEHSNHCVEYLRQAVMCSGDLTLEPAEIIDGQVSHSVSGWGVEHQCRDWDYIYNAVFNRRPNNVSSVTA
ncbi:hypothetical protein BJX63DRAFT_391661 [Aspergillus granulosus]|uniref:Uncharacterized protein n=1 Tax=Aspergillus granulosus TaxID=176169 RepID=A0ABR4HH46_9EURO